MGNNTNWPQRMWPKENAFFFDFVLYSIPGFILSLPINSTPRVTINGDTRNISAITTYTFTPALDPYKQYSIFAYFSGPDSVALEVSVVGQDPGSFPPYKNGDPTRLYVGGLLSDHTGTFAPHLCNYYFNRAKHDVTLASPSALTHVGPASPSALASLPFTYILQIPFMLNPNELATVKGASTALLSTNSTGVLMCPSISFPGDNIPSQGNVNTQIETFLTGTKARVHGGNSLSVGAYVRILYATDEGGSYNITGKYQQVTVANAGYFEFVDPSITANTSAGYCVWIASSSYSSLGSPPMASVSSGVAGSAVMTTETQFYNFSATQPLLAVAWLCMAKTSGLATAYSDLSANSAQTTLTVEIEQNPLTI